MSTRPAVDVVEQATQRLRILGAVTLLLAVVADRRPGGTTSIVAAALVAAGLVATGLVARRLGRRTLRSARSVVLLVAADALLVVAGLWTARVDLSSPGTLLLVVPVLEAATRFRVLGAFACWGWCVGLLAGRELLGWQPGDPLPLGPLAEVALVLVVTSLPAAYLAEHLTAQLVVTDRAHALAERRVRLLVDLATATRALHVPSVDGVAAATATAVATLTRRPATVAEPIEELPDRCDAAIEHAATDEGRPEGRRAVVSVRGEDAGFTVEGEVGGDPSADQLVLEALEVLAAHAGVTLRNAELHERLERSVAELAHQARHDAMTGLPNRAHLVATAQEHLAARRDAPSEVALLYLDLDGFKPVNDRYGHEAGDAVLVEVARRLSVLAAPTVLPARLGGDEFAVLVTGRTAARRAATLAPRVVACVEQPFDVQGVEVRIGVSLGLAVSGEDGDDVDALLRAADARMYDVKAGRSVVRARR